MKVWTDAAFEPSERIPGRVAFVVFFPAEPGVREHWVYGESDVPPEVMAKLCPDMGTYIGQLEMLAAVAVYHSIPELAGRRVIHWIDNTGAVAALVKGYAAAPDSARILHALLHSTHPRHGHGHLV